MNSNYKNQLNQINNSINIQQINKEEIKYRVLSTNLKHKLKKIRSTKLIKLDPNNYSLKGVIPNNTRKELENIVKPYSSKKKYYENKNGKLTTNIISKNKANKGKINEDVKIILFQNYGNNF